MKEIWPEAEFFFAKLGPIGEEHIKESEKFNDKIESYNLLKFYNAVGCNTG